MAISEAPGAAGGELPEAATVRAEPQAAPAFRPFIPAEVVLPELTPLPLVAGTILGVLFGASSLYLVLKVGITVSASIPVAVISITLFRMLAAMGLRRRSILENNFVQTAGSAGESIAFGIGVTMPAILILGFDLEISRVALVAVLGGLLGILMMIPLRRALIGAFRGWKDVPQKIFGPPFDAGSISAEISPELLGVGYIIGPRIGSIMCAGGVLAYLVLIPAIKFFGSGLSAPLAPGTVPISQMSPDAIRGAYILYIGAGAVAAGGIISLLRSMPTIWSSLVEGLKDLRGGAAER